MDFSKYLNDFYLEQLYDNYEEFFLNDIDEENFIKIYMIFKKYNFYFIQDIILAYLEIFTLDSYEIDEKILKLKEKLGSDFVKKIGNKISYLDLLYDD